jgi:hypothetical protein
MVFNIYLIFNNVFNIYIYNIYKYIYKNKHDTYMYNKRKPNLEKQGRECDKVNRDKNI